MKFKVLLIMMVLAQLHQARAQFTWIPKASMSSNRYVPASFTIGSDCYVGTGYLNNNTSLGDWWKYDPALNSWTQVADMPAVRASAVAFAINGKGYCGLGLSGAGLLTDFYEYDPVLNAWTPKAPLPAQARYGAGSFVIGDTGYVCCGNRGIATGPFSQLVFGYDATSNTWSQKASFPGTARYGCRGGSINGKGYLVGGIYDTGSGSTTLIFSDLWQYDPATNLWWSKTSIPGPGRHYPSVFVLNNRLVCGNGMDYSGNLETFQSYNPVTDSWTPIASMPVSESRWGATAFSNGTDGFVATGSKTFGGPTTGLNDLWTLTMNTSSGSVNDSEWSFDIQDWGETIAVISNSSTHQSSKLIITSSEGKKCSGEIISDRIHHVDKSNLSTGIYFATLSSMNETPVATKKFFVIGR